MITEETRRRMEKVVGVAKEEAEKLKTRIVGSEWEERNSGRSYRLHLTLPGGIGPTVTLTRVQIDDQHNVRGPIHREIEAAIKAAADRRLLVANEPWIPQVTVYKIDGITDEEISSLKSELEGRGGTVIYEGPQRDKPTEQELRDQGYIP